MNIATLDTMTEAVKNYNITNPKWVDYNSYIKSTLGQYSQTIQYAEDIIMVKGGISICDKASAVRRDYNFEEQSWFVADKGKQLKVTYSKDHITVDYSF